MLRLLSDEDFNGRVVAGVLQHTRMSIECGVQEVGLSGHEDPDVLAWAAEQGRIILTNDKRTMIGFATRRVDEGLPMPGLFVLRRGSSIKDAIEAVAMVALASDHADWDKQIEWLPF